MSKKLMPLISIVLIAAFLLAACQTATQAPTSAPQPTTAAQPTTAPKPTDVPKPTAVPPTEAPKGTKITIWHQWSGDYLTAITAAFKDYEKAHPGVTIDLNKPQAPMDAMKVAIPAGEGPDIVGWANDGIGSLALPGYVVPLDSVGITADFLKSVYTEAGIAGVTYAGKIWALPETMEGIAFVYNKKLMTDKYLGMIKNASDFDGLLAAAEQFKKDNPDKTLFCNQGFPGGDAYHIAPVFFGFGIPQYVDEAGKVSLNTPEGVKAMEWLVKVKPFLLGEEDDKICTAEFEKGTTAMRWTGPWAIAGVEKAGIDYGILPFGKPFVGIKTLMLSKNGVDRGNTEVALDIMKYFTSADVQKKLSLVNKTIPAQTAALADPEVAKLTAVAGFGQTLAVGVPMSASPFAGAQWGPVGDTVKAIWTGKQAPAEALAAGQKLIEDAIAAMK